MVQCFYRPTSRYMGTQRCTARSYLQRAGASTSVLAIAYAPVPGLSAENKGDDEICAIFLWAVRAYAPPLYAREQGACQLTVTVDQFNGHILVPLDGGVVLVLRERV